MTTPTCTSREITKHEDEEHVENQEQAHNVRKKLSLQEKRRKHKCCPCVSFEMCVRRGSIARS